MWRCGADVAFVFWCGGLAWLGLGLNCCLCCGSSFSILFVIFIVIGVFILLVYLFVVFVAGVGLYVVVVWNGGMDGL